MLSNEQALALLPEGAYFGQPVTGDLIRHIVSTLHAQADAQPVGVAGNMPGTDGFTMACFKAADVPLGTSLYTHPAPEAAQAGLSADWLWGRLMDYCKKQGIHPANANDLFAIVTEARELTRASAATVAEPSEEPGWKNERCQYEVCDEEDEHDPRCTAWRDTESQEDSVAAFLSDVASQTPEKPDHWSSCAQCQHNAERAADLLSVQKNTPCGGKP